MDDSCAVCAEPLQWVAYGPCGHREVCSNCVVRLRFICEDRRCCLCKSESEIIFITKALGDFTRMINDFAVFPADPREGQVGTYWYHEGTQAYFDDVDHYKIIKAMCRLSCSACDKRNEWSGGSKGKGNFRNVELLKSHLAQRHRLSMCSLCLEGRKVFICEQKLYTKAQLDQHIKTGDSEVDGSETERGGFMGHPICQFCEKPYYGEHELYSHMQTEHYTCHICQRQHPGKYEYYKNYDDLEIHFRQAHFLCEDEGCLEKKFVVFTSESEMKRHNALEHGGRMSRAKRSAALQIPISFQYRQFSQQDRRGRGRRFNSDSTGNQLSEEVHDTPVTSDPPSSRATSSNARAIFSHRESGAFESVGSFELLTDLEGESSSVDTHAIRPNSRTALLEESSFPPLPAAPSKGKKKNKNVLGGLGRNSTASRLHPQNNSQAWSTANGSPNSFIQSFPQLRPVSNSGLLSSSSSSSLLQNRSTTRNSHSSSSSSSRTISIGQAKPHEPSSSTTDSSSRKLPTNGTIAHPSSAPNLLGRESFVDPVSATRTAKAATRSQISQKAEDVNAANMSLVERIRLALEFDENRYAAFNKISSQYRHGVINTEEYLANVCQFGLSHLVLELARLCPDPDKQRELVETYKFNTRNSVLSENDSNNRSARSKNKRSSKKGKEKCEESGISTSEEVSIDSIISSMKNLGSNHKNLLDRMDGLSKHADQSAKGKAKILTEDNWTNIDSAHDLRIEPLSQNGSQSTEQNSSNKTSGTVGGGNKPRKKTPKYLRNRLGNDAASSRSELGVSELNEEKIEEEKDPPEGLPVSGVWRNGGGRKLAAMTQKNRI